MNNYVPNFEDRYYEVHPSQLRWAMSQLGAVPGYNVQGYAQGRGGMYIVVVQVPIGAPEQDWRDAPPPRRRVRFDISPRMIGVLVAVALLACAVGYAAYSGFTVPTWGEVTANMPQWEDTPIAKMFQPPPQRGEPVVERSGWHWPWESSVISRPAPRDDGFRWPWDDAAKQVSDTVDMVKNVTLFVVVLLLLGVALWFVAKVKGVFK